MLQKPTSEEDPQTVEEERYLNKKRKASRLKERQDSEKREDGKKESGKERGSKRYVQKFTDSLELYVC